jgi:TetR/AcrR family transcriptional regulator
VKTPPPELTARLIAVSDQLDGTDFDVTIDAVAKLVDVPRATLYYYFSGKEDLIAFFLNAKFSLVRDAIATAAATDGTVSDRLARTMTTILHALSEHPPLCTKLPIAVKRAGMMDDVMANADRVLITPIRELLIEGRATGEFAIPDINLAATALMGALSFVGMMHLTISGRLDADRVAEDLVPMLVNGLRTRN